MEHLVTIFGVVLVLEGIPWFLSPGRVRSMLAQLARFPDTVLRWLGFVAMAGGLLMVWLGRG